MKQLSLLLVSIMMSMTVMALTTSAFAKNGDSSSDNSEKFVIFFDKPTPSDQAMIPHGVSQHKDSIDTTHFVGEVKNTGAKGIKFAEIIANFR